MIAENGLPVLPPGGAAGQFKKPIGVDRATVETLKNKVVNLEAQILSLGINDDQAVILYRSVSHGWRTVMSREDNSYRWMLSIKMTESNNTFIFNFLGSLAS